MPMTVVSWLCSFSQVTPEVGTRGTHGIGGGWNEALGLAWVTGSQEKAHCEGEFSTSHPGGWWLSLDKMEMLGNLS